MDKVILVDKLDNPVGEMEKQEAHIKGLLHRAFSIFIFIHVYIHVLQQIPMIYWILFASLLALYRNGPIIFSLGFPAMSRIRTGYEIEL